MNKLDFLSYFVYQPDKIRMRFIVSSFFQNATIEITKEEVNLRDVLDFYVPKYKKEGKFDTRVIDVQVLDFEILPLKVCEVMLDPIKWDLGIDSDKLPSVERLYPIPIATDLISGRTLLLDSNHTITSIVGKLDLSHINKIKISVIRIKGRGLEAIIGDFNILNREKQYGRDLTQNAAPQYE